MPQCGKCQGPINAENVRASKTPAGITWRIRTYCEFCKQLVETRVRQGTPSLFPRIITDRPTISRFLRSSVFATSTRRKEAS
jgi:hypothetical protein